MIQLKQYFNRRLTVLETVVAVAIVAALGEPGRDLAHDFGHAVHARRIHVGSVKDSHAPLLKISGTGAVRSTGSAPVVALTRGQNFLANK